jgi:hypothetical protein
VGTEGSGFNVTIADQYIGHDGRRKYYCVGIGIIVIVIIKSWRGRRSSVVVVAVIIIDARWARATIRYSEMLLAFGFLHYRVILSSPLRHFLSPR